MATTIDNLEITYPEKNLVTPYEFDVANLTMNASQTYGTHGKRATIKYKGSQFRMRFDPPADSPLICRYGVSMKKGFAVDGAAVTNTTKTNNDLMYSIGIALFNEIDQSEYQKLIVTTLDKIRNWVIATIDASPVKYIDRMLRPNESMSSSIAHIYTFPKVTIDGKKVADESTTHKVTWYTKLNVGSTKLKKAQQKVDSGETCTDLELDECCYTKFYDVSTQQVIQINNKRRATAWTLVRPINDKLESNLPGPFELVSFLVEFQGVFFGAYKTIQVKLIKAIIRPFDAPLNQPMIVLPEDDNDDRIEVFAD